MRALIGRLSRVATSRLRGLVAVAAALALVVTLLAGVTGGPLAPVGNVLAAGGATYTGCPSEATFSGDLAGVTSGSATFTFPAGCEIDLTSALTIQPGVSSTIDGNGLILKGNGTFDIIDMTGTFTSTSTLSLNDVTVEDGLIGINSGGLAGSPPKGERGDGGSITLNNSTVTGNQSDGINASGGNGGDGRPGGYGGTVTLINSTVSGNVGVGINARAGNGGNGHYGNGLGGNGGTVTLTSSTVSDNGSDNINASGGSGSSTSYGDYGGPGGNGGTVTLTNSTNAGSAGDGINAAGGDGGYGFDNGGNGGNGGTVSLTSSTISGNAGQGISLPGGSGGGAVLTAGGPGYNGGVTLTATILADTGANCASIGSLGDGGYNLSTDSSCAFEAESTSKVNVPLTGANGLNLQPLGNYGGPTQTIALDSDSIAVNFVQLSGGQCVFGSQTDQRGVPRPQGPGCDVGAYELIQGSYTQTESNCPTQAQLQNDLDLATPGSALTINLPPNCTINLVSSNPTASPNPGPALSIGAGLNITVNGNGLKLVGKAASQLPDAYDLIDINDQSSPTKLALDHVNLENGFSGVSEPSSSGATVTLTNGTVSGAVFYGISASNVIVSNSTFGGGGEGILVVKSANVSDSTFVIGNGSSGITTEDGSTTTVTGSTFTGNGTGIDDSNGSLAVSNSTFSGNQEGLFIESDQGFTTTITVTASTFSGDGVAVVNGASPQSTASVTLTASILAGSQSCDSLYQAPFTDGGYNLVTDTSCGFGTTKHSQTVTATQLNLVNGGALGNYGGPTQTIALGPGSVAIDAIPTADCAGLPATDQRGTDRPQGTGCDAGAYEAPAATIATSPGSPASTGWYNATTLGGQGKTLGVSASFTGLATGELPTCSGATFTGLPATAVTGLTQTATGSASLGDGTYSITCEVDQGTTPLGVSQSPTQPVKLNVDTTPPSGECSVPDQAAWYVHNVSVGCTPTDATSGLSGTTPSSFSLTTTVANGTADASAATGSQQICDVAGNCKTIGPFDFKVDLAPPTISSPAANAGYTLHQTVPLTCTDVGSGLKTCAVTVTLPDGSKTTVSQGNDVPTSQPGVYTVTPNTVTDVAGNADTTSFAYTVSYQLVPMPGNTATVHHGYFALIRFAPEDVHGVDEASRTLTVTALELDGPGGQVIPFVHQFQFTMAHNTPQYQLELNTRNLAVGPWTVKVQIGTGATATTGTIMFTVE